MKKVILISIDGMRPDGLLQCGSSFLEELMQKSSYTLTAQTVMPSITLPCHMSMFHSVPPERHGTVSNQYVAPAHPVKGLFEQIEGAGKNPQCTMAGSRYAILQDREAFLPPSLFTLIPLTIPTVC